MQDSNIIRRERGAFEQLFKNAMHINAILYFCVYFCLIMLTSPVIGCWWPGYLVLDRDMDADGYDDETGERRG